MNATVNEPQLRAAAEHAMQLAYAPYSDFRVGAALLCVDGEIIEGCNVENSSFPSGGCAERGALFAAVVAGHRQFTHLVIVTEADEPTPPPALETQGKPSRRT